MDPKEESKESAGLLENKDVIDEVTIPQTKKMKNVVSPFLQNSK